MTLPKSAFPVLLAIPLFLLFLLQSPHAAHSTASTDRVVPAISESTGSSEVDSSGPEASTGIQIRLQQAVFDPLQGPPALPPALTTTSAAAGYDYYFVQFNGPILVDWRVALERQGAEIMDYVPDFAYVVRMDEQALLQVTELESVRWIGLYQPAFRLHNDLIRNVAQAQPGLATELVVRLFAGETADALTRQVDELGATVLSHAADSGGGDIFTLLVPEIAIVQLAHIPAVAWIEPVLEPTLFNSVARSNTIMGQDTIESVLGLYGQNQIVAVGDTGLSTGNPATVHADFAGRVIGGTWGPGTCGTWADDNSHGTHVAGSVLGSGFRSGADIPNQNYAGSHAGIAPEADLYVWSFCNDFSGLPAAPYADYYGVMHAFDSQLRINTNSWGYTSGHGQYNTFTRETDRFVRDHQDMVLTYAAGNDGTDGNSDGVVDLGSMTMPGTAKNIITVGASENVRAGNAFTWGAAWPGDFPADPINSDLVADNADGMAAFSGRGPTSSDRIKPDVVAPGTNIVSARNESTGTGWGIYDTYYLYMGGTSMATPLVAGASAIVREFYDVTHNVNPSAALVKATLINGAYDMTPGQYGTGATQEITRRPDNVQGWGRVDLPNTLIHTVGRELWFHEHAGLNTGESYQITFDVFNSGPFRATLVWTDFQGTEASHGALVNDLDLVVEAPDGTIYLGNEVLAGGRDETNNVEGVDLMPVTGTYTVTVSGFNVPQGPQPFALVVTADFSFIPVGYLTGIVDDGVNAIVGATVTAVPTTTTALTDGSGVFSMTLPVGSYDVTAEATGYLPLTIENVTILSGTVTTQNFSLLSLVVAHDFTCAFDLANWTLTNTGGSDGFYSTNPGPPIELFITGGDSGSNTSGDTDFWIEIPTDGVISFDWGYQSNDSDDWDAAYVVLNGVATFLADNASQVSYFTESYTLNVQAGDIFAFRVHSVDNMSDPGVLGVTNFAFGSDYMRWRGDEDSDWNNPANWQGAVVPTCGNSVILDPAYQSGAQAWPVLEVDPEVIDLIVEGGAALTIPDGRFLTVNGTLTNNGLLRHTINDVPASTTTHFLHVTGSGGDAYRGVEITPAAQMGPTTVEIRGNQECTTDNTSQPVQRCFDLAPTNEESATIRFYYLPAEANGNAENSVNAFHWDGSNWQPAGGTPSHSSGADPRWVEVPDVTNYSPFVLDNQVPTAVTLAAFSVRMGSSLLPILLLLLVAAGSGWVAWRRLA